VNGKNKKALKADESHDPIPLAYSNSGSEPPPEPRHYDAQLRVIFFIGGLLLMPLAAFLPDMLLWGFKGFGSDAPPCGRWGSISWRVRHDRSFISDLAAWPVSPSIRLGATCIFPREPRCSATAVCCST
jgi:hypothetical protein